MSQETLFPIVCISESELLQWVARGRIHLLMDRVIGEPSKSGCVDLSLFAACPVLKLDDAKGRVWVTLRKDVLHGGRIHPYAEAKKILDLPLDDICAVGSILPQYRRRLESIPVPLSDVTLENEWGDWLVTQGAYERHCEIVKIFRKIGFELDSELNVEAVKVAMRPHDVHTCPDGVLSEWRQLMSHRDDLLQKLRFDGHAGEKTFLRESVLALIDKEKSGLETPEDLTLPKAEGVWGLGDITASVSEAFKEIDRTACAKLPYFVKAAYLRCFDDLYYGAKDWSSVFNLVRYVKYSIGDDLGCQLLFFLLGSTSAEEMIGKKLSSKF